MKTIILEVIAIKEDTVMMNQINQGSFKLSFSKRSPALQTMKLKVGDLCVLNLKRSDKKKLA